ncbi:PREDICTED: transcription activator GLK1-like [Lupinus angustifolius]|uniref:transcription activator GLK1-like n=1 Tax=Lupinus angustifolius TaxID=3871 RepID=UPI00092F166B|nr:PREDICTED: transcription activator GLK1-like [Lupinus angustifolius]
MTLVKEAEDFVNRSKGESEIVVSSHPQIIKIQSKTDSNRKYPKKVTALSNSCETKANRKKVKVDWTPEMHKKFVKALGQLGIDQEYVIWYSFKNIGTNESRRLDKA